MNESGAIGEAQDSPLGGARVSASRDGRSLRVWAFALAGVTLMLLAYAWMSTDLDRQEVIEGVLLTLVVALPTVSGLLILRVQPRNVVGWFLLGEGVVFAMMALTDAQIVGAVEEGRANELGTQLAVLWSQEYWPLLFVGFAGIAYVFPDGRLFNPLYRRWAWVGALSVAAFLLMVTFTPVNYEEPYEQVGNPLAVTSVELPGLVIWAPLLAGFASMVASAFAVRARLRASTGDRRLQMLWLAWATLAIPGTFILCVIDGLLFAGGGALVIVGLALMAVMMPVAIAIGILRYRLFDIEVVINRTLVYGTLTVVIACVYAGIVAGFGYLIGNATAAGVVGAGVVAVIVQPVYERINRRVDRMVYGDRSDPYAALQRLDARLAETLAPGEVVQAVVDSVAESLRLPWSAVEFERDGTEMTIAAHGARGRGTLERRQLAYRGETVGSLLVEVPRGRPLTESDHRLLNQLASHVGAAVQSVRLTIDLQQSRKELVTAREEERRRLRRDLHDGVGPSLAAMSMQLEVLRDRVDDTDAQLVDQLGGQVQDAIADIRRLVYELRPPALDQYGLVSALSEQAARMSNGSARFSVHAEDDLPQLSAAVEVAVYRIALEGMTNASRHSGANRCDVTIATADVVSIEVEDNGVGIARDVTHGVGLRSMRERTAELGGEFVVESSATGGTMLRASFPMEEA